MKLLKPISLVAMPIAMMLPLAMLILVNSSSPQSIPEQASTRRSLHRHDGAHWNISVLPSKRLTRFLASRDDDDVDGDDASHHSHRLKNHTHTSGHHRYLPRVGGLRCFKDNKTCVAAEVYADHKTKASLRLTCCGGKCYNLQKDKDHCGVCHKKCHHGEHCCSGKCVNKRRDSNHCGRCNRRCNIDQPCEEGFCGYA